MTDRILYEQSDFPVLQNRLYSTRSDAINCHRGDIRLVQDDQTGLIHNTAFDSSKVIYDHTYQNEQGLSEVFKSHLIQVGEVVERTMGKQNLVEVGCGKGFFLEQLLDRGFDLTGFDPTYEGNNPNVEKHFFEPGVGIRADGIILRHVLEHIQNPIDFLDNIREANANSGKIYIEVPCFDWICTHNSWFDIFYEHVNYFRISDFKRMFSEVVECGNIFGGQYIYVVAELSSLRRELIPSGDSVVLPDDFLSSISKLHQQRGTSGVWGAASKGVIFSIIAERNGFPVDCIFDINPAKQNKYLPVTGLQVSSPESIRTQLPDGATVYVMNSNYLDEIRQMTDNKYNYIGVDNA